MSLPKFGAGVSPFVNILDGMEQRFFKGLDFLEIPIQEPYCTPNLLLKNKEKIKKFVENNEIFLLAHPPHWNDISTSHEKIRKAWVEEYKEIIDVSHELDIKKIVVHPHFKKKILPENIKKEIMGNIINSLEEISDYSKDYGIKVLLENEGIPDEIASYEDFKYIVDNVEGIKVILDVGHAFRYHDMNNIMKYLKGFRKKIDHLHFHDNHGDEDEHLPIGVGKIDYKMVVDYLKKIKYDKTITFEIFADNKDYIKLSIDIVKKMWR